MPNDLMSMFERHAKLSTRKRVDGLSKSAYRFIKCYLKKYINSNGNTINKEMFLRWMVELNVAPSTKSAIVSGMGKFLQWHGFITSEDFDIMKSAFRSPEKSWSDIALEKEDIEKAFISSFQLSSHELSYRRNPAIIMLFGVLGARISQLIDLDINDIRFEEFIVINLPRKKDNNKTLRQNIDIKRVPRDIKIGRYTCEQILLRYLDIRDKFADHNSNVQPFFINHSGGRLSPAYIQRFVKNISKKMGKPLTSHSFRHYVGSHVAKKYGLLNASVVLGHSRVTTTQRYVNPEQQDISESLRI